MPTQDLDLPRAKGFLVRCVGIAAAAAVEQRSRSKCRQSLDDRVLALPKGAPPLLLDELRILDSFWSSLPPSTSSSPEICVQENRGRLNYRNRENWGAYVEAVNEMVGRTSTTNVAWELVPANDKPLQGLEVELDRERVVHV